MGLAQAQSALARLYTDEELRRRFLQAPAAVGTELGLTPEEVRQIKAVSVGQLKFFAASLIGKRRQEVEKLLPLTCRALGERFRAVFAEHARTPLPAEVHKHHRDAIAFAAFVQRAPGVALPVRDLARYECAWLEARVSRSWLIVHFFRYPVGLVARRVMEGTSIVDLPRRLTLGLWLRHTRLRPWHHRLLPSK